MIRETEYRKAHRQLMWEPHETRPATANDDFETSTVSDTVSMRSSVVGSEADGLSIRGDDYETPVSSFTDRSHVTHFKFESGSPKLLEQKRERLGDKNPWRRRLDDNYTL
jgi:hypothetical protein